MNKNISRYVHALHIPKNKYNILIIITFISKVKNTMIISLLHKIQLHAKIHKNTVYYFYYKEILQILV